VPRGSFSWHPGKRHQYSGGHPDHQNTVDGFQGAQQPMFSETSIAAKA
jgi:hypothetical protein